MAAFAFLIGFASAKLEHDLVESARRTMTAEDFERWQRDRTAERRHQQMCEAIRDAGERADRRQF